ncbi:MAG: hypothetical protein LBD88_03200 [Candidatus Peribacteria bacterium]|jgi:hypothetical protein|nr:hypothetical protein [Candidatus Peribacteria bacterium]
MQEKEEDKINQELAEKEELEKQEELKKQEELIKQEEEEKKQAQVTAVKEQELKINTEQAYKTIKESFFKKSVSQQKTILQ